jgi:predicted aldo/keto reductase-like oxidoreductase
LQWLWDQPEVAVVLSGMSNRAQLDENLASANRSCPHCFGAADREVIAQLQRKYLQRTTIPCTQCRYCLPCPTGVNIPMNFELFNDALLHEDIPGGRTWYRLLLESTARAGACTACRTCEDLCPQQILISEWMPKIDALLAEPAAAAA